MFGIGSNKFILRPSKSGKILLLNIENHYVKLY